ncbi:MAG: DUF3307 domain-containing protein [Spirosomataceae bacterium]
MMVLLKLMLAHFIGDFLLQPTSWVKENENRKVKSAKLYLHGLIHGLLVLLVLWDIQHWRFAMLILIAHVILDTIKLYAQKKETTSTWFFIDQTGHITCIILLWIVFFKPELNTSTWHENKSIWIYSFAVLFLTVVSGIGIKELMSSWSKDLVIDHKDSLNDAGKYIGMLERLLVFLFVLLGKWEGIGFLLAAKSVFRFGDLKESKDRKLTEYILIGTLISFGIAIATGLLVVEFLKKL